MRPNIELMRTYASTWLTEVGMVYTPGPMVTNPETGVVEPGPPTAHYQGPCLVRPHGLDAKVVMAGEAVWTITRYDVTLPANATAMIGHRFKLTACPFDPALIGVELRLVDVPLDSWQVSRMCIAEVAG